MSGRGVVVVVSGRRVVVVVSGRRVVVGTGRRVVWLWCPSARGGGGWCRGTPLWSWWCQACGSSVASTQRQKRQPWVPVPLGSAPGVRGVGH